MYGFIAQLTEQPIGITECFVLGEGGVNILSKLRFVPGFFSVISLIPNGIGIIYLVSILSCVHKDLSMTEALLKVILEFQISRQCQLGSYTCCNMAASLICYRRNYMFYDNSVSCAFV